MGANQIFENEQGRGRFERDAFKLRLAVPDERAIPPAELLVVLPAFSVVDLAVRGLNCPEDTLRVLDCWITGCASMSELENNG